MRKWHKISILFDDFYICFINENISKYDPLLDQNECTLLQKRTAPNISPFFNKQKQSPFFNKQKQTENERKRTGPAAEEASAGNRAAAASCYFA